LKFFNRQVHQDFELKSLCPLWFNDFSISFTTLHKYYKLTTFTAKLVQLRKSYEYFNFIITLSTALKPTLAYATATLHLLPVLCLALIKTHRIGLAYNVSSPSSRKSRFPTQVEKKKYVEKTLFSARERFLNRLPGCLVWMAFSFCILGAAYFPRDLFTIAVVLAFYSMVRFLLATFATLKGSQKIRRWQQINWQEKYQTDRNTPSLAWEHIYHLIIIPNYNEPLPLLAQTLQNLACSPLAKQMIVVLAMEAQEKDALQKAAHLQQRYAAPFAQFHITLHPAGLPGEIPCKSANQAWAARWIKKELVDHQGFNINHLIVTTMDADTLWHKDYFSALTTLFTTDPARHNRFWQAPIRYHANIWQINPLLRLVNAYSAAFELAYLSGFWWRPMPISSYSLSLRLLHESDYWDTDVIADEWHMLIKAFFAKRAKVSVEPIYLPFLAYATTGETFFQTLQNRYLQTLRHAWGSKEIGYSVSQIAQQNKTPLIPAFTLIIRVAHDLVLSGTGWMIVTVGGQLPFVFHPDLAGVFLKEGLHNPAFVLMQTALLVTFILSIFIWVVDVRARPPRSHPPRIREQLLTVLSFVMLPVMISAFVALPVIHAQTSLMLGKRATFRVSRKL